MPTTNAAIIAIDILLEPDARMLQHAQANNARLLKAFPNGFSLDATHRPHITTVQRFVRAEDLDKVYAAIGNVLNSANITAMNLVLLGHKIRRFAPALQGFTGAPYPERV